MKKVYVMFNNYWIVDPYHGKPRGKPLNIREINYNNSTYMSSKFES